MRLAVFDIDGTLVAGPSTEKRFFWWLARRGRIGPRQLFAFLWFTLRHLPRYGRHTPKKNKAYLSGHEVERVAAEAEAFVRERVADSLFGPAVARLRAHQAAGDAVVMVSGTLEPIAAALGRLLGVDHTVGSRCDTRHGRCTARPPARHPFAADKRALLDALCAEYSVSAAEVSAYGDSAYDLPLLEAVGEPIAVRPDKALLARALAAGWQILPEHPRGRVTDAGRDVA